MAKSKKSKKSTNKSMKSKKVKPTKCAKQQPPCMEECERVPERTNSKGTTVRAHCRPKTNRKHKK